VSCLLLRSLTILRYNKGHGINKYKPIITNICGPLKSNSDSQDNNANGVISSSSLFATATLDGTLQLSELKRPPYWELQAGNGQLCDLRVMDMTGDGEDNIVGCWWDGFTIIADKDRNVVTFKFDDRVSAFFCGDYSVQKGKPLPCFVYVTFYGEVIVYYNVRLDSIPIYTLKDKTNTAEWDPRELPSLFNSVLYHLDITTGEEYIQSLRDKLAALQAENKLLEK